MEVAAKEADDAFLDAIGPFAERAAAQAADLGERWETLGRDVEAAMGYLGEVPRGRKPSEPRPAALDTPEATFAQFWKFIELMRATMELHRADKVPAAD